MRSFAAAVLVALAIPPRAAGQVDLTGYALTVAARQGDSELAAAGATLVGRARLMLDATFVGIRFDAAYEHVASRTPAGGGFAITSPGGARAGESDWLGVDWELHDGERASWRHRLDRASAQVTAGALEVTVGRQAVSWATTLLLTPADPFTPFDPSDPFRQYRGGVDALRVRAFLGPFSEVEGVVRPTETALGTTWTALARGQTSVGGWAVGGWGGALHDQPAGALFATGALGATAVRSEVSLREAADGNAAWRAALGFDRFFTLDAKDLYWVAEAQYDGFGASSEGDLLPVAASAPYARGELQTLGAWTLTTQLSYQLHPLVAVDGLVMVNAHDRSALLASGVSWSATSAASVRAGLFSGSGQGVDNARLGSEYGAVPTIAYLALSWFF